MKKAGWALLSLALVLGIVATVSWVRDVNEMPEKITAAWASVDNPALLQNEIAQEELLRDTMAAEGIASVVLLIAGTIMVRSRRA